jgi:hypothetical protein
MRTKTFNFTGRKMEEKKSSTAMKFLNGARNCPLNLMARTTTSRLFGIFDYRITESESESVAAVAAVAAANPLRP